MDCIEILRGKPMEGYPLSSSMDGFSLTKTIQRATAMTMEIPKIFGSTPCDIKNVISTSTNGITNGIIYGL